jgi:hypothetical protein
MVVLAVTVLALATLGVSFLMVRNVPVLGTLFLVGVVLLCLPIIIKAEKLKK